MKVRSWRAAPVILIDGKRASEPQLAALDEKNIASMAIYKDKGAPPPLGATKRSDFEVTSDPSGVPKVTDGGAVDLRDDEDGEGASADSRRNAANEKRGAGCASRRLVFSRSTSRRPDAFNRSARRRRSTQFREIVTGPLVVCTRIGFPPPPSGMFSSREIRPETVTGMSVRIGPLTVPTSSEAA